MESEGEKASIFAIKLILASLPCLGLSAILFIFGGDYFMPPEQASFARGLSQGLAAIALLLWIAAVWLLVTNRSG